MTSIFKNTRFGRFGKKNSIIQEQVYVQNPAPLSMKAPIRKERPNKFLLWSWVIFGACAVVVPLITRKVRTNQFQNMNRGGNYYDNRWNQMQGQNGNWWNGDGQGQGQWNYGGQQGQYNGQQGQYNGQQGQYNGQQGQYNGQQGQYNGQQAQYNGQGQGNQYRNQQYYPANNCKWWQWRCTNSYYYGQQQWMAQAQAQAPEWYEGWGSSEEERNWESETGQATRKMKFVYGWQIVMFAAILLHGFRTIRRVLPTEGLLGMLLIWANFNFLAMWMLADSAIVTDGRSMDEMGFYGQFSVLMFMTNAWYTAFGLIFSVFLFFVQLDRYASDEVDFDEESQARGYQNYKEPVLAAPAQYVPAQPTPAQPAPAQPAPAQPAQAEPSPAVTTPVTETPQPAQAAAAATDNDSGDEGYVKVI